MSWRTNAAARRRLEQRLFGKRILFTNRNDWPTVEVVAAYRSQSEGEGGFRQLRDPHVVSFCPKMIFIARKLIGVQRAIGASGGNR